MLRFALKTLALVRSARISPEKVARIQRRRLRSMVRHAVTRSPFYREKYRGIDPDRFELTDLPPTNKGELMADYDRVVTSPLLCRSELERFVDDPANEGTLFRGRFAISHTSGSQGQPMLIAQEPSQLELLFALQMSRGNSRKTNPIEAVKRFVRPARLAVVTLKRGFYPSASTFEYMPAPARRFLDVLRLSQTDTDVVERLNAFRPSVLTGYASVLETLALEALAGRLRLDPELIQVVNNSEVLSDRARSRIQAAFGLPVMNNYATGECPFLTNACRAGLGPHVNADWAIFEVVDDEYRPVPAGTAGKKVLITNLANTAQPFLRYEVGDVVTMATTPCGCGNALPRVGHIEGRSADVFWIRDGSTYRQVINSIFKNAFDYTREVREWQAVQTARNRVLIRLELLAGATLDAPHTWAAINRQLAMYDLSGRLQISLELVDRLAPDAKTGKFRRMQSEVGPPDGFSPGGSPAPAIEPLVSAA
jgi:phenylacetate-CoA ligase